MHLNENPIIMYIPMIILALFSIFIGYLAKDLYLGLGATIYNNLFIHPNHLIIIDTEFSLSSFIKLLPLITSVIFSTILLIFYELFYHHLFIFNNKYLRQFYNFFIQILFFDQILYNYGFRS